MCGWCVVGVWWVSAWCVEISVWCFEMSGWCVGCLVGFRWVSVLCVEMSGNVLGCLFGVLCCLVGVWLVLSIKCFANMYHSVLVRSSFLLFCFVSSQ